MANPPLEQSRFNARLPKAQKELFEKAASLGGYRNLTDFIFAAAVERAKSIIHENESMLTSAKDAEVFFNAITNPSPPTPALKEALVAYDRFLKADH